MSIIQTDTRGKFVPFITDNYDYYSGLPSLEHLSYSDPVELGLEKPLLQNPLKVEASLQLYAKGVSRYTGSGETTATTDPIVLDLLAVLKTMHAVSISPSVMTLDEDNNYTTFCAVETNEGAEWTLTPLDPRLTVTPASGVGRASVVVRKAASFNLTEHFYSVPITATSTANVVTFPDIDGERQVSDTAEVHVEQYAPQHNALIPKMLSNTSGERDGNPTSNVTVAHHQSDTADELNAAYASNSSHAAFAIASEDDILHIDMGKSVVLDRIEITGINIRRTLATGIAKGGAALSFSILGANDPNGTWSTLRDGSSATDFTVLTGTTSVGHWNTRSANNVAITNTGTTAFRYYRLVPHNRTAGQELSFTLHRLHLYEKVTAAAVSMTGATITDSRNTAASTLTNIATNTNSSISINNPQYRFTVDFGAANPRKADLMQITTSISNFNDRLVQALGGIVVSVSNDGTTWTSLLVSDRPAAIGGSFAHWFDLSASDIYRYYRIEITNPQNISYTLSQVRFFEKNATGQSISCLLPKNPYLTCPQKWESPVKITSQPLPSAEAWKSFDNSLTINGLAGRFTVGMYSAATNLASHTGSLNPFALDNLEQFPSVEVSFDVPHRIRSWSLQSVGGRNYENTGAVFESLATVLVLWGRTLDGKWKILDLARTRTGMTWDEWGNEQWSDTSELYTATKTRLDRPVQHVELVDKIRIAAIAVQDQGISYRGFVWFPQIQVFAGVPVLPKMQQDNQAGVQVRSNGGTANNQDAGIRVFDREVSGNNIAVIGSRAWYINNNHFLLDDVAENGNISQFGSFQSKAWLAIMFPLTRILGYLYSIDNLLGRSDNHANVSYAASLYFEGRQTADANATLAPSSQWDFIDLVSLDRCIGHNMFGKTTEELVSETGQTTINTYIAALGLPMIDRTFLMNRTDRHVIRYDVAEKKWYNDGLRLAPGSIASDIYNFNNMTTEQLLTQAGQSRLNSVALTRGESMQPTWNVIPHKSSIVNQRDNRRMMYDLATQTWSEVPNNDAIYHVHDRTHYADLKDSVGNPLPLAQLRCTAQSIMNTERPSVGGEPVAMPEVQFFGLPAGKINTGAVATVTYLKTEDALGNLHNILGRHQRLRHYSGWGSSTTFRLYLGTFQNIKSTDRRVYLSVHTASGTVSTSNIWLDNSSGSLHRDISVSGDYRTSPAYFELFVFSAADEKIVLSSGYTGGLS
jgi:hypothetical protein